VGPSTLITRPQPADAIVWPEAGEVMERMRAVVASA